MKTLNEKQLAFIDHYLVTKNATEAAKLAGYSQKTAYSQGQRLLKHDEIKLKINEGLKSLSKATGVTAEFVINELKYIAQQRGNDVGEWVDGMMVHHASSELSDEILATISSVEVKKTEAGTEMKIKRHDKMKALEMLARHLQLFEEGANDEDDEPLIVEYHCFPDDENSNRTAADG